MIGPGIRASDADRVTLLAFAGLSALGAMGGISGMAAFSCH